MGFGEFILKVLLYSFAGGWFLSDSAKAIDGKSYFSYGLSLMLSIPFIVKVTVTCIEFFK